MPLTIVPAASFYGAGSGSSSSDGHSHTNLLTLSKLSTDSSGHLCFNGDIVGEKAVETACNITLSDAQITQKSIALPDDCDTSRVITLSLNGISMPQGKAWQVRENANSSATDFITWEGLSLENFAQIGDNLFVSYYKKI